MDKFVLCPSCESKDQIPEDEVTAWAIPVSDMNFESKVLNSPLPVLLEFISSTCGACSISKPVVNQLAAELKGKIRVCRTDVLVNPAIADRYNIMSTPTSLVFDRGQVAETIVGVAPREILLRKMAQYLTP